VIDIMFYFRFGVGIEGGFKLQSWVMRIKMEKPALPAPFPSLAFT